mgnify:CR=1 FL=1
MASRRLEVVIAGNAGDAVRALGQTERAVGSFDRASSRAGSRFSSTWRSGISSVGSAIGGLIAGAGLAQFFRGASTEAEEAARVMRQTTAVIDSTGGVAGITAGHLSDLAGSLSDISAVDDEVIQQGGNLLLTFRNVRAEGGIFDDALASALDMSAAMGTQLQPNIMAVGRALNDPIAGISRLTRMGVTFTQQQKDQIAAMVYFGDAAGAQRIILEELATEFGGAAEANATSSGRMRVAWENLQEQVGTGLLPAVEKLADGLAVVNDGFARLSGPVQQVVVAVGLVAGAAAAAAAVFSSVWAGVAVAAVAAVGLEIYGVWRLTQPLRDLFFGVVHQLQSWWTQSQNIRATMAQIGAQALSGLRAALGWVMSAFQVWWSMTAPVRGALNVIGSIGLFALRSGISNVIALLRLAWNASAPLRSVMSAIGAMAWGALRSAVSSVVSNLRAAWNASAPLRSALATLGAIGLSALRSAVQSIRSGFEQIGAILDSIASKIRNLPSPSSLLSNLPGFAGGTVAAPAGLAIVGERGPELVRFRGGESVMNATTSRSMMQSMGGEGGSVINVYLDKKLVGRAVTGAQRRDARSYGGADGGSY